MFSAAAGPIERPEGWRSNSFHHGSRSIQNSPSVSRNSSVTSFASARTDPGVFSDSSRQSSATSTDSVSSKKSGFSSLFGKKEKKPKKEKKNYDQIVLTSKHAAAVKTKLMMDTRHKDKTHVRTAGIVSSVHTGHLSAAQQEARHPHSGPPALHAKDEMPALTRIASGDEQDDEDEFEKMERVRLEWQMSKQPVFAKIKEHESDGSANTSAETSEDESNIVSASRNASLSPSIEKALNGMEPRRPVVVAKNSYGGRFHKDESGHWKR